MRVGVGVSEAFRVGFVVGCCVGVRPRGYWNFGFSSDFYYNSQARARETVADSRRLLPIEFMFTELVHRGSRRFHDIWDKDAACLYCR
jgi:hypothetical protein